MKILVLADEESKYFYDFFEKSKLDGIDLIISCGDLKPQYLSFLATFTKAPVLYVHGNHDEVYETDPPDGCICIDDDIYVHEGVRIMGLGGCMEYTGGIYQFTERDMHLRYLKMIPKIFMKKGIDILVTHAPAYNMGDGEDLPHRGFKCFVTILDKYKPKLYMHGHVHLNYGREYKREKKYNETLIINGFQHYIVEL